MTLDINSCSDPGLGFILKILKTIFTIIEVVSPIVLIVSLLILFTKLLANPEDKKLLNNIKNAIISCIIIFLIPVLVNLTMSIIGGKYTFSDCWNNAYSTNGIGKYIEKSNNKDKKSTKIYIDEKSYKGKASSISSNTDSSVIAELACAVAGSFAPENKITNNTGNPGNLWVRINDSRVKNYQDIMDAVSNTGNGHDNSAYCSCTQAAAAVIRATVDKEYWMIDPTDALNYMDKSPNWKLIGISNSLSDSQLEPGDVFATTGHTMIWVSNKVAKKYRSWTTGNMYQADSIAFAFPGIDKYSNGYIGGNYKVYRFIGTPTPAIDYSKYIK